MQPWVFLLVHLPSGKHLTFHCIVSIFQVLLSQESWQLLGESQLFTQLWALLNAPMGSTTLVLVLGSLALVTSPSPGAPHPAQHLHIAFREDGGAAGAAPAVAAGAWQI